MPLRGDQRALLQLICERGQSYEDISELLGKEPEEIRSDARGALEEIGGADPDADVGLTDFLLGQADPIGRADATRYLQSNPEALDLAKRIHNGLQLVAPEANLPKLPEPRGKRARAAIPAAGEDERDEHEGSAVPLRAGGSGGTQGRLIGILVGIGVILILGILVFSGVFKSDDDSSSGGSDSTTGTSTGADTGTNKETVNLKPVDGSGVAGTVTFSIVNSNDQAQAVADVRLQGLPQPKKGEAELLWLMVGENGGFPLGTPLAPDENGNVSGSIAVPGDIASSFSGQFTGVKVSRSNIEQVTKDAAEAVKQGAQLLGFSGDELASGEIPQG